METTDAPTTTAVTSEFFMLANSINLANRGTEKLLALWLRNGNHPSIPELTVLQSIKDGIQTPSEIARSTGQATPSVSNIITSLTNRGLVEREKDIGDGRRRKIMLTQDGENVLTNALTEVDKNFSNAYIPLEFKEMARIRAMIDKYIAVMRFPFS